MRIPGVLLLVSASVVALSHTAAVDASTEVFHSRGNNSFATAISNPPGGPSQLVGVVRDNSTPGGGPITELGFYYTDPNGCFFGGTGAIPNDTFHVSASSASLDVDLSTLPPGTISFFTSCPDVPPPNGVISVSWAPNGSTRTSGNNSITEGNLTFRFVGTRVDMPSNISGTLFGTALVDPYNFSYISLLHNSVIIIERN
jgi:hypothetical protein